MDDFHYSAEAENVMNLFYQAEAMVYVEGPDDICFWEIIFNKASSLKVEIKDVGGCEELKKYIDRVTDEDLQIIIACDADFTTFENEENADSRIVKTYGHSIENTFIDKTGIYKAIKTLGKLPQKIMNDVNVDSWTEDFYTKMEPLIKLDIYNHIYRKGISVIGDSADRFMKSRKSNEICEQKITSCKNTIIEKLGVEPDNIDSSFKSKSIEYRKWLRGHFLFSAVHRYISTTAEKNGKKVSLSYESLYSNLMNTFESNFTNTHIEFNHYHEKIKAINMPHEMK
ncbi:DUF4435 domain-containing protein [Escherichia coli]|uniref:DUF4435 domain-containing protein n=1 Tax=Escherichia coli TaxID=562 RepID=UPI000BE37DB0|nr:DUF4435 domain-containing protein [Escherichia coli]EFI4425391.1 DUF4435 domain-containing protein [Escherichia coli]EFJ2268668.1 DUF4435 domain-containing protein [Escherichia coli]EFO1660479.1 DUF4435 domain-containing protein [Escherichia coli]MBB9568489.1 DUF4435 domain-containing protein [Escherichia coli]HAX1651598.1 DUF4435 domain-containing protein [Escherichia coli]